MSRGWPCGVLLGVHRVGLARAGEDRRFLFSHKNFLRTFGCLLDSYVHTAMEV